LLPIETELSIKLKTYLAADKRGYTPINTDKTIIILSKNQGLRFYPLARKRERVPKAGEGQCW
jgi:hypothetical protein